MTDNLDRQYEEAARWRDEGLALRRLLLDCDLTEARKWNKPCYEHDGDNIAIVQRMKPHLALMFFKGAILTDPDELLRPQGPNSQSAMRVEITSVEQVEEQADALRRLIADAIDRRGQEVPRTRSEPDAPEELEAAFGDDPAFEDAFTDLTPGRQRGWILHFSDAKQSETRVRRIEKAREKIMDGKGPNDR